MSESEFTEHQKNSITAALGVVVTKRGGKILMLTIKKTSFA
jgi:hypothetical protein